MISIVALVVGLLSYSHSSVPSVPKVGDVVNNSNYNFTQGVNLGNRPVNFNVDGNKIPAKSSNAFWRNTTGMTQYVTAEISTDGQAQSTYNIYAVATSSAPRTLYDFIAPLATSTTLINNFALATSSIATTTSSYQKAFAGPVVQVPDGWYVNFYLRSGSACIVDLASGCFTATSTSRGFNLNWRIFSHN